LKIPCIRANEQRCGDTGYPCLHFEIIHDVSEALREHRHVTYSVALARLAEPPDEIGELDHVVHDLVPILAIEIDLLIRWYGSMVSQTE